MIKPGFTVRTLNLRNSGLVRIIIATTDDKMGSARLMDLVKSPADNSKNSAARIVRDKAICGGEPVFKGTRVTLRTVLASLAAGDSAQAILSDFPTLQPEDIQAAIAFAAASAEEDLPVPPVPQVR